MIISVTVCLAVVSVQHNIYAHTHNHPFIYFLDTRSRAFTLTYAGFIIMLLNFDKFFFKVIVYILFNFIFISITGLSGKQCSVRKYPASILACWTSDYVDPVYSRNVTSVSGLGDSADGGGGTYWLNGTLVSLNVGALLASFKKGRPASQLTLNTCSISRANQVC